MFSYDGLGQHVAALCMFKCLFVNATPGSETIRITLATTMTGEELERGAAILKEVLATSLARATAKTRQSTFENSSMRIGSRLFTCNMIRMYSIEELVAEGHCGK